MIPKPIVAVHPWYRHRWPWILISGPFLVVVAGMLTAYLAIVSNDGLVDDDYYKQGLAINQETARNQAAAKMGLQAEVMQNAETRQIRIILRANPEITLPTELRLRITHPTRTGADQHLRLSAENAGVYSGRLSSPLSGRWHIALEDEKGEWRLGGDWVIEKEASLRLSASVR